MSTVEDRALERINNLLIRVDVIFVCPDAYSAITQAKQVRHTASALMLSLMDKGLLNEQTVFYKRFVQTHALLNIHAQQIIDMHTQPAECERYLHSPEYQDLLNTYCPDLIAV